MERHYKGVVDTTRERRGNRHRAVFGFGDNTIFRQNMNEIEVRKKSSDEPEHAQILDELDDVKDTLDKHGESLVDLLQRVEKIEKVKGC
jgi:hypothetical protein